MYYEHEPHTITPMNAIMPKRCIISQPFGQCTDSAGSSPHISNYRSYKESHVATEINRFRMDKTLQESRIVMS